MTRQKQKLHPDVSSSACIEIIYADIIAITVVFYPTSQPPRNFIMLRFTPLSIILTAGAVASCGSSQKSANSLASFHPSHAMFATFTSAYADPNSTIGSILLSSDPDACAGQSLLDKPYLEVSLFANNANVVPGKLFAAYYPISSEPIASSTDSGSYHAAGDYRVSGTSDSYVLLDSSSNANGHVSVSAVSNTSATIIYEITVPGVGTTAGTIDAVYCKEYGARLQQARDTAPSQPG